MLVQRAPDDINKIRPRFRQILLHIKRQITFAPAQYFLTYAWTSPKMRDIFRTVQLWRLPGRHVFIMCPMKAKSHESFFVHQWAPEYMQWNMHAFWELRYPLLGIHVMLYQTSCGCFTSNGTIVFVHIYVSYVKTWRWIFTRKENRNFRQIRSTLIKAMISETDPRCHVCDDKPWSPHICAATCAGTLILQAPARYMYEIRNWSPCACRCSGILRCLTTKRHIMAYDFGHDFS